MSRLRVLPIVEGHGESAAVRILLERIWVELLGGEHVDVLRPIRQPRSKLVQREGLQHAVDLASRKLKASAAPDDPRLILILIDADHDLPCVLGPGLLRWGRETQADMDVACVLANVEYETWFVASAESLGNHIDMAVGEPAPDAPEEKRAAKHWIQQRFKGTRYSPTVDQPSMTKVMDLARCRERSPSFDKLCRELEKRM